MRRMNWKTMAVTLAALGALVAAGIPTESAVALPRGCTEDCPERPDPPGGPTGPSDPEPQPVPPSPFGTPSRFTYDTLANQTDTTIRAGLSVPAPTGTDAWPLPTIPFTADIAGAPVRIVHLTANVWAFSSVDGGGRAFDCQASCSDPPAVVLNPNYGLYQATLHLRPRLDLEIWEVNGYSNPYPNPPTLIPNRLLKATATLHMRAFAECSGWETATAHLNAKAGVGDVTVEHDAGILERIGNFFLPGLSASINAQIRTQLITSIGVGQYANIVNVNGHPCYTLGVSGGAGDGSITWNEQACINPETGCHGGGVFGQ